MHQVIQRAKAFLKSEDGPTATEYAVMLALIVAVVIGAVTILGGKVKETFEGVTEGVDKANQAAS
ncbi:MAG: Flp family type IVb pilin [Phycisphaerales bacterium]|jgi:pilus assembly protein Flp/PilA|nr:Flp family type IVb pilin [Phycisphaerales bacterium]